MSSYALTCELLTSMSLMCIIDATATTVTAMTMTMTAVMTRAAVYEGYFDPCSKHCTGGFWNTARNLRESYCNNTTTNNDTTTTTTTTSTTTTTTTTPDTITIATTDNNNSNDNCNNSHHHSSKRCFLLRTHKSGPWVLRWANVIQGCEQRRPSYVTWQVVWSVSGATRLSSHGSLEFNDTTQQHVNCFWNPILDFKMVCFLIRSLNSFIAVV